MGKNQSASNLPNIIKQDANGSIAFMHGNTMLMQVSSSGAITTTGVISGSNALSASYAVSASAAASAVTAVTAQTASFANAFTVAGNLTAQTLVVQTITSSVDFVTGSTRFGSLAANTHQFTGSMFVSGALSGTSATFSSLTNTYILKAGASGLISNSMITDDGTSIQITRTAGDLELGLTAGNTITAGNSLIALYSSTGLGNLVPYGTIKVSPDATGNTRAAKMVFATRQSGGTLTNAFTIDSSQAATFSSEVIINGKNTLGNGILVFGSNNSSLPAALGSSTAKFQLMNGGVYGLAGDVLTNGNTYFQSQRTDGNTAAYNLLLQPLGGNVGIGTSNPVVRFQVKTATDINLGIQTGTADTTGIKLNAFNDAGNANVPMELNGSIMILKTGEAERMRITSAGYVTTPFQPFASVGLTTDFSSAGGTIVWQQVHYNVGSRYNSSTGAFTCPVAGTYLVSIMCMTAGIDQTLDIGILINGGVSNIFVPYQSTNGGVYNQVSGMTMLALQANDTIAFRLNSGSIYGAGGGRHSSVVFALVG